MEHRLKQILSLIIITALTALTQETFFVRKLREPGDTLDISISQELDHAAYNGIRWLKRRQNKDGSFGEKDKLRCTALSILVLANDDNTDNAAIISNAINWLVVELNNNATTNIDICAWSCAAMTVAQSVSKERWPQCATSEFLKRNYPESKGDSALLCAEILLSLAPAANIPELKREEMNETNYHCSRMSSLKMWLNTRSINSGGSGQLFTVSGRRIDWRREYAKQLIGKQRIDSAGGGYWKTNIPAETICETALSIMILKEL